MAICNWSICIKYVTICTGGMCKVWLIHTRRLTWLASWLGIYVHARYIWFIYSWVHPNLLLLHSPFLMRNPLCFLWLALSKYLNFGPMHTCYISILCTFVIRILWLWKWTMVILCTTLRMQHGQWVWWRPILLILFGHPEVDPCHLFISGHH